MQKEHIAITGKYRVTVKRADGTIERSEWKNTINSALLQKVNDIFRTTADFALNSLFSSCATPPASGKDGIIVYSGSHWYSTNCTITEPSSTSTKVTGVFTGYAITVQDIALGFSHSGADADSFNVNYADPDTWNNITLQAADQLTIEWTISVANS